MRKILVGSRGSRLALIQTESVLAQMKETRPELEFSLVRIRTRGDRMWGVPLDRLPTVGAFVKDLEEALLAGQIDMAVHSLKDLPTEIPSGLSLAAVLVRLDPRDVLVSGGGSSASSRRARELARAAPGAWFSCSGVAPISK